MKKIELKKGNDFDVIVNPNDVLDSEMINLLGGTSDHFEEDDCPQLKNCGVYD
jgi:hypothetical protein